MDTESQILTYKNKVASFCIVFLFIVILIGLFQAYNMNKLSLKKHESKQYTSMRQM
jgi:hypothetical protein